MKYLYYFSFADFDSCSANALNTRLLHKAFCKKFVFRRKIEYKRFIFINSNLSNIFLKEKEKFLLFPFPKLKKIRYLLWIFFSFFCLFFIKIKSKKLNKVACIHTRDLFIANLCEYFKFNYSIECHRVFKDEIIFLKKVSRKRKSSLKQIFALTPNIDNYIKKVFPKKFNVTVLKPVISNEHKRKFLSLNSIHFGGRNINNSSIKLVYLGHPHNDRGILDSISYLCSNQKFSLIIIGVLANDLEKLRKKFYSKNNNLFLAANIPYEYGASIIDQSDALLIPYSDSLVTKEFCYPSKATEYMNSSKPIFSSDLDILKSIFKKRAFYFITDNYKDLKDKLESVLLKDSPKTYEPLIFPDWEIRAKQIYKGHL